MNPVDYIEKYPERTQTILGISYRQWKQLTKRAMAYNEQQQEKLESIKIRVNAKGGGRKPILTLSGEIGLCLFYLRQMPTFGNLFHIPVGKVSGASSVSH